MEPEKGSFTNGSSRFTGLPSGSMLVSRECKGLIVSIDWMVLEVF